MRALVGLVALFVLVHVVFPVAGALAYRHSGEPGLKAAVLSWTTDPLVVHWLGGLFARDGAYYIGIADEGYRSTSSWAFFPLYPYAARFLGPWVGGIGRAGLAISFVASGAACVALYAFTSASRGERAAARTVALFLATAVPLLLLLHFYTESLYFALRDARLRLLRAEAHGR